MISKIDRLERGKVLVLEVLLEGNGKLEGKSRRGFLGMEECHDEQTERKRSWYNSLSSFSEMSCKRSFGSLDQSGAINGVAEGCC